MSGVRWREWGETAFDEAKQLERPVFLFLEASWCRFCRRMDQEVLRDAAIEALLNDHYVPVRVDKDRRPEVNDRYNLGGWPSTCILTAGGELITGGTWFDRDALKDLLDSVARFYAGNKAEIASRVRDMLRQEEEAEQRRKRKPGAIGPQIVERVQNAILAEFDPRHGGFGTGQKFPHPESLDFALLRYVKTGDTRLRDVVDKTLAAMADGPIHDREEGGFFRYSVTPDWSRPHTEKLLETNVGLLRNYLEACQVFERPAYRQVAERIVDYLRDQLRLPDTPAFGGSQDSDDAYYRLDRAARRGQKRPNVDATVYVNLNAAAASALFKAAVVLGDPSCSRLALDVLGFLLEECYDPGRGMYHYHDGGRHILGLLTDQAYTVRALIHAAQFTGDRKFLDVAEDLLQILAQKYLATGGGFYDVPSDARAGLRRRNVSILENALLAEACIRAHHLTLKDAYLDIARRTLAFFAEDYHLYGYFTAGYARAVDLYLNPPVHAVIVGRRHDDVTQRLVAAASRLYLPSKLVQVIDPDQDEDLLQLFELPAEPSPTAYVTWKRAHVARVTDPEALPQVLSDAEQKRR